MATLTQLTAKEHRHFNFQPQAVVEFARQLHVVNLRVAEIPQAVSSLPVVFSKHGATGQWLVSGITSLEQGHNMFVDDSAWSSTYEPLMTRTYPFYFMQSPDNPKQYVMGFDAGSSALTEEAGVALFDDEGAPTEKLVLAERLLEQDLQQQIQTQQFMATLDSYQLIQGIDILVHYQDGQVKTLRGLHTINEDRFAELDGEALVKLNQSGYLAPIMSTLTSLYQLNQLIRRHNQQADFKPVNKITMEKAKS